MRAFLAAFVLLALLAPAARAQSGLGGAAEWSNSPAAPLVGGGPGAVILRGNYWRDRNTRVIAPEAEFRKEIPNGTIAGLPASTLVGAGYLLDAITSASIAAGVTSDQPFTELRNQLSVRLGERIGPVTAIANYRYSTESDYWAHAGGATIAADLFEKNTTLALTYSHGHDQVAQRLGPTGYLPLGYLDTDYLIASWAQVLAPWLLGDLSYDFGKLGNKGDPSQFLGNAYRQPMVNGANYRNEIEPHERDRHSLTAGLRLIVPKKIGPLRYLAFYGKYRFYADSWGQVAHTPELRTYARLGPVELRLTGRYHTQSAVAFWPKDASGQPMIVPVYTTGVQFGDCGASGCATADAKLGTFHSYFIEARLAVDVPLGRFLGDTIMAISYGHYFNDLAAHAQFGDAEVAGTEIIFPF